MNANETTTTERTDGEKVGHRVLLMVLRCKNTMQRGALTWGTLRRADAAHLLIGLDWLLERGFVQYGTSNASAKAWSRGGSDELLYVTKSGKAWLRTFGNDFGSVRVMSEMLASKPRVVAAPVASPPSQWKPAATDLNISVLDDHFPNGVREIRNGISATSAPHLRRCIKAGLLTVVERTTLRLTDEGVVAIARYHESMLALAARYRRPGDDETAKANAAYARAAQIGK